VLLPKTGTGLPKTGIIFYCACKSVGIAKTCNIVSKNQDVEKKAENKIGNTIGELFGDPQAHRRPKKSCNYNPKLIFQKVD